MRKLRKRPRPDRLENQPRKTGSALGQRVYLALLALLLFGIANYVAGDRLLLRADGLVLRHQTRVAATSIVRIESVEVRPGQTVRPGDVLFRTTSAELLDRIADYAIRHAELTEREGARNSRLGVLDELVPLAETRLADAEQALATLETLKEGGLVSTERYERASESRYAATNDLLQLSSESRRLNSETAALRDARARAGAAVGDLERHYAGGVVRATTTGSVGDQVPVKGEVFLAGELILDVHSGRPHVLAYLPDDYLFGIDTGRAVAVTSGRVRADGRIVEILPVSQTLPRGFQNAFKPDRTRQLARIEFDAPPPFPTHASVHVTGRGGAARLAFGAVERFAETLSALTGRSEANAAAWEETVRRGTAR